MCCCIDGTCMIMSFVLFVKLLLKLLHMYCMNVPWFKLYVLIFQQSLLSRHLQCTFTLSNVICNNVMPALKHGVHSLVLMIKYYIFCSKCSQTNHNIPSAWQYIYKLVNIEKYIVTYHVMSDKFEQKCFFLYYEHHTCICSTVSLFYQVNKNSLNKKDTKNRTTQPYPLSLSASVVD